MAVLLQACCKSLLLLGSLGFAAGCQASAGDRPPNILPIAAPWELKSEQYVQAYERTADSLYLQAILAEIKKPEPQDQRSDYPRLKSGEFTPEAIWKIRSKLTTAWNMTSGKLGIIPADQPLTILEQIVVNSLISRLDLSEQDKLALSFK